MILHIYHIIIGKKKTYYLIYMKECVIFQSNNKNYD